MLKLATSARKLKITAVIDAAPFVKLGVPPDNAPSRTILTVAVGGRTITAGLATKSVRKAVKTLLEHGTVNIALVLQGELNAQDQVESAAWWRKLRRRPTRRNRRRFQTNEKRPARGAVIVQRDIGEADSSAR